MARKRKIRDYSVRPSVAALVIFITISTMMVGYAYTVSVFKVRGQAGVNTSMLLRITSITLRESNVGTNEKDPVIEHNTKGIITPSFYSSGSDMIYDVVIENSGSVSATLKDIKLVDESNNAEPTAITMNIDSLKIGTMLNPGETKSFPIIVSKSGSENFSKTLQFELEFVKSSEMASVADSLDAMESQLTYMEQELDGKRILKKHPVGSIYVSTSSQNPGPVIGGTWESFGVGRTIMGVGTVPNAAINGSSCTPTSTISLSSANQTGGKSSVTLTEAMLPPHKHSILLNTSTATIKGEIRDLSSQSSSVKITASGIFSVKLQGAKGGYGTQKNFSSSNSGDLITADLRHSHTVSGKTGSSGQTNPTAVNLMNPYTTVYMWKRTA